MKVSHYVFYHNNADLTKVKPSAENSEIQYVNLDEIELPSTLKIDGLSEQENRAVYSEFLGMLTIKPTSDMVGLFTYSIPHKFSYDFAKKVIYPLERHEGKWMLPPIKFDYLSGKTYDKTKLYGAYFRQYVFSDDPANPIIEDLDRQPHLHMDAMDDDTTGPFNGTVIVSRDKFLMFQRWLQGAVEYLLERHGWVCGMQESTNSENMKQAGIGKDYDRHDNSQLDKKFRRGIGHVLERCFAYYFGRAFSSTDRVDMKRHLNDRIKLYIFSSPSHDHMKNKFFLPSIKDNFEIVEETHNQSCQTGEYHSDGWDGVVHQKVDLIIRAIHENWGRWFIHSDVDIQFFGEVEELLRVELGRRDIVFQNDCPYPRPVACAGFFACRGNERTLSLWEAVKASCIANKIDDQHALNSILHAPSHRLNRTPGNIKWRLLPTKFYSPGAIPAHFLRIDETVNPDESNLLSKIIKFDHSWRWTPVEVRNNVNYAHPDVRKLQIPADIVLHHANYTEGIGNKVKQLEYVANQMSKR